MTNMENSQDNRSRANDYVHEVYELVKKEKSG